ncbi:MAG: hypothetical protein HYV27_06540 [Candidatus Hydrogenedentes bacterium]|nr:hypothetical protein [Candidatus Hydrogenedentota bacterium]
MKISMQLTRKTQWGLALAIAAAVSLWTPNASAAEPILSYDPAKIVANEAENCSQCHARSVQAWTQSTHKVTYDELHQREEAKTILTDLGMSGSIRRNDECVQCHYTQHAEGGGEPKTIMGISCQRCHGAAVDWLAIHQDVKGRPDRAARLAEAAQHGMRLTDKIYELATSCYRCHTVPREDLVNKGHHKAGSDFELVAWSQGEIRHNFLPLPDEAQNKEAPAEERRLLYVIGKLLDMEYTLRGLAVATAEGDFLTAMGERANRVLGDLKGMGVSGVAEIDAAVKAVPSDGGAVKVAAGNEAEYLAAADAISTSAKAFEAKKDSYASNLAAVDSKLPTEYKGKAFE